jgi:hypothetical protein
VTAAVAAGARRAPVDLPEPYSDHPIAREPMWFEYACGVDEPAVPPWTDEPAFSEHVPPAPLPAGPSTPLPLGTHQILERTAFPAGRASGVDGPLARALVTAFGPQWRDPDNAYPGVHRGYASARCLYPVQVFLDDGSRWWWLDPARHALVGLADAVHSGATPRVVLAGRYSLIPRAYKWFRGSIVGLELGIALRALGVALELFGLSGQVSLPGASDVDLLDELGLRPGSDWSLPLVVSFGPAARRSGPAGGVSGPLYGGDVHADVLRINRGQDFREAPAPLGAAIPAGVSGSTSWAELLWQRNSGLMPRGLHGMSARRRRLPTAALTDAARWATLPPPTGTLRAVAEAMTVTAVVQDIDGHPDGVHRVRAGAAEHVAGGAGLPARLEAEYGYPLTPDSGCDIRHAAMVWFFSVRPRELVERFGPGGWTAAQYVAGWQVHGLSLAAAGSGLFARPVRAFNEIPAQRILGLGPDEMVVLSAVTGTPRTPSGVLLDIRL